MTENGNGHREQWSEVEAHELIMTATRLVEGRSVKDGARADEILEEVNKARRGFDLHGLRHALFELVKTTK